MNTICNSRYPSQLRRPLLFPNAAPALPREPVIDDCPDGRCKGSLLGAGGSVALIPTWLRTEKSSCITLFIDQPVSKGFIYPSLLLGVFASAALRRSNTLCFCS